MLNGKSVAAGFILVSGRMDQANRHHQKGVISLATGDGPENTTISCGGCIPLSASAGNFGSTILAVRTSRENEWRSCPCSFTAYSFG